MKDRDLRTSCRTIGSSHSFERTSSSTGSAELFFIWPRQYASSCFRSALSSENPSTEAGEESAPFYHGEPRYPDRIHARCAPFEMILTASSFFSALSVKSALKRLCRGTFPAVLSKASSRAASVEGETLGASACVPIVVDNVETSKQNRR